MSLQCCQLSKLDQWNHKLRNNRIAIEFDIFEKLCEMIANIIKVFLHSKNLLCSNSVQLPWSCRLISPEIKKRAQCTQRVIDRWFFDAMIFIMRTVSFWESTTRSFWLAKNKTKMIPGGLLSWIRKFHQLLFSSFSKPGLLVSFQCQTAKHGGPCLILCHYFVRGFWFSITFGPIPLPVWKRPI